MKLSIIIVNYNVKYYLEQCLDSIFCSTKNIETEIFIVDNHSSDGSVDYLKPRYPDIKFIENQENVGFAKANNQALAEAQGEYILLLNPDTLIGQNTLKNVCRFMDKNPQAGAVGVKMIDGYGHFLPESKRGFPSPWNSFCKMTGLSKLFPYSKHYGGYSLKYLDASTIHQVDILAGAFMMVRKEAVDKVGYLDEHFFMYGEDIDWSYRFTLAGYSNYYFPEPILHYKGESTRKDIKYVKHFYRAMLIFFNKYYPNSNGFFKFMIHLAIIGCGTTSAIQKIMKPIKSFLPEKEPDSEIIFDLTSISYRSILLVLDQYSYTNLDSKIKVPMTIYNPEIGFTIGPGEVTFD